MKKIKILLFSLILTFCMSSSVFAAETPQYNSSYEDNYISVETMKNVVKIVGLDNYFDTDLEIEGLTYQFNTWSEEYLQTQQFSLINIMFFRTTGRVDNDTHLQWTVGNGSFSNTLPYIYLDINAKYPYIRFYNPETSKTSTCTAYASNTSSYYSYTLPSFTYPYEITNDTINVQNFGTALDTYIVYVNSEEFGVKSHFLTSNYEIVLDPTINPDVPESGDTGSGDNESGDTGGGTTTPSGDNSGTITPDYSEKLDNIQGGITNIENKIPTSGELQELVSGETNKVIGAIENQFGEGSGEVTSEQIENLQNEANKIMSNIVPANNFVGMFNQIISSFSNALLGEGEEKIEFDYKGEHYVISSNQINLPIEELKGFISVFFNVAIIMGMALSINWIIRKMEEGDLISVISLGDADMYFYEDLNMF